MAAQLERDDFVVIRDLVEDVAMRRLRRKHDSIVARMVVDESVRPADKPSQWREPGVARYELPLDDLDRDEVLLRTHPVVCAIAEELFCEAAKPGKPVVRAPLPGAGHQGLHTDVQAVAEGTERYGGADLGQPWPWIPVLWPLRASTRSNGALRVVPGSHRA